VPSYAAPASVSGSPDGAFQIVPPSDFVVPPGNQGVVTVRFTPQSFGSAQGAIVVSSNGGLSLTTLTALAGVGVSGMITQPGGIGFPGITIQVGGGASFSTRTDRDGFFTAVVGPNNGYIVTPSSPGLAFTPQSRSVIVTTLDIQGVDFNVDTGSRVVPARPQSMRTILPFVGLLVQLVNDWIQVTAP
jgi:hypothetical protein